MSVIEVPLIPLVIQIPAAFLLDLVLGDPQGFPHPVRAVGALAAALEPLTRRLLTRRPLAAGAVTWTLVMAVTVAAGWGLLRAAALLHPLVEDLVSILLLYTLLAMGDLHRHARRVVSSLEEGDLEEARRRTAFLVSRSTEELDEPQLVRATVESVAENLVDGVTAPLFWALVGGPLAVLAYKAASTMDSMFGYKTERYLLFGRLPARADDLLNLVPARLTAALIVPAALLLRQRAGNAARILRRDGRRHASPNAGLPEAAVAGALGVRIGGPSVYFGQRVDKPTIGDPLVPLSRAAVGQALRTVQAAAWLFLAGGLALRVLIAGVGR